LKDTQLEKLMLYREYSDNVVLTNKKIQFSIKIQSTQCLDKTFMFIRPFFLQQLRQIKVLANSGLNRKNCFHSRSYLHCSLAILDLILLSGLNKGLTIEWS